MNADVDLVVRCTCGASWGVLDRPPPCYGKAGHDHHLNGIPVVLAGSR